LRAEAGRTLADQVIDQIETATRYSGYVAKQRADVERASRAESTLIPAISTPTRFERCRSRRARC
jgi:tRNA uridine 5-carboxymethylaminomethyl modification enzyme